MPSFAVQYTVYTEHIDSVKSLYAVTPTPYHECKQLVQKILLLDWIKVTLRSQQTAYIHSTELVWSRTFMAWSWCDWVKWPYGYSDFDQSTLWRKWTGCSGPQPGCQWSNFSWPGIWFTSVGWIKPFASPEFSMDFWRLYWCTCSHAGIFQEILLPQPGIF